MKKLADGLEDYATFSRQSEARSVVELGDWLTDHELLLVTKADAFLHIEGRISYSDGFGHKEPTRFVVTYVKGEWVQFPEDAATKTCSIRIGRRYRPAQIKTLPGVQIHIQRQGWLSSGIPANGTHSGEGYWLEQRRIRKGDE